MISHLFLSPRYCPYHSPTRMITQILGSSFLHTGEAKIIPKLLHIIVGTGISGEPERSPVTFATHQEPLDSEIGDCRGRRFFGRFRHPDVVKLPDVIDNIELVSNLVCVGRGSEHFRGPFNSGERTFELRGQQYDPRIALGERTSQNLRSLNLLGRCHLRPYPVARLTSAPLTMAIMQAAMSIRLCAFPTIFLDCNSRTSPFTKLYLLDPELSTIRSYIYNCSFIISLITIVAACRFHCGIVMPEPASSRLGLSVNIAGSAI